jgi:HEAT repeat protein
MHFFCPCCWKEIEKGENTCPYCGCNVNAADALPFAAKLRAALRHPEPQTPIRAAWILGERREVSAVPDLITLVETSADSFLTEAAARALGKIGDESAVPVLKKASESGTVRVRLAARKALEQIRSSRELSAEK